jgi:O-succinylbenzoic acid--CoA ligase
VSVVDVLGQSPGRPEKIAVVGPDAAWSYAELEARVDARAQALGAEPAGETVQPGGGGPSAPRVVSTTVSPDVASIVELLALWRLGRVPAPLNARLSGAEHSAARVQLASTSVPPGTQVVLWTSGTSGRPRGIALSWGNLEAITRASHERLGLTADDVWVASLSPAHVGGLVLIVRALLLGGTLLVPGPIDAASLSELLDIGMGATAPGTTVPTHVSLVPTQLHRILEVRGSRRAPSGLRCALIGGAHAPATLVARAVNAGWPLALTYGATEMSSQIATAPPDLVRVKAGTVGSPMDGVEIMVTPAGEIRVRGRTLAVGSVGPGVPPLADQDGWYHTGDLGRIDDEGHLWITGRRIDRIVSGGVTIDAVEVEEAIRSCPGVGDACVVGVSDPEWGERVGAWVEPASSRGVDGGRPSLLPTVEALTHQVRELVGGAKVPRVWRVSSGLPRNPNGKADRATVRDALGQGGPASVI